MTKLDSETVERVCKIGQEAECRRYLVLGPEGFGCAKHNASIKDALDTMVETGDIRARGDNCEGKK